MKKYILLCLFVLFLTLKNVQSEIRMLYLPLHLTSIHTTHDQQNAEAINSATWFTHIYLSLPAIDRIKDPFKHQVVWRAIFNSIRSNKKIIWSRRCWEAWMPWEDGWRHNSDHVSAAFYAKLITTIKKEAERIGAYGTSGECEPYGRSPQKLFLQGRRMHCLSGVCENEYSDFQFIRENKSWAIRGAILSAIFQTGKLDFIYPAWSGSASSYVWSLSDLGRIKLVGKTYRIVPPEPLSIVSPHWKVEIKNETWMWGIWINNKTKYPNTSNFAKSLSVEKLKKYYPKYTKFLYGLWVYSDDLAYTIKTWDDTFKPDKP